MIQFYHTIVNNGFYCDGQTDDKERQVMTKRSRKKLGSTALWTAAMPILLACASSTAWGGKSSSDVEIKGFMSFVGSASDSKFPYAGSISKKPSLLQDSNVGINFSKALNSKWDVALQFVTLMEPLDGGFTTDWAFISYYPVQGWSFRVGTLKIPFWILSEYSHVGKEIPWVRPPIEVYSQIPVESVNGLATEYQIPLGALDFTTSLYAGSVNGVRHSRIPNSTEKSRYSASGIRGGMLQGEYHGVLMRANYLETPSDIHDSYFDIFHQDLTLTTVSAKVDIDPILIIAENATAKGKISKGDKERIRAEYDSAIAAQIAGVQNKTIAQRQVIEKNLIQYAIQDSLVVDYNSYYVMLGVFLTDDLLAHLTYAEYNSKANTALAGTQSSVTTGLKYDLSAATDLKMEWHHAYIKSSDKGLISFDPATTSVKELPTNVNVYSLAIDVVF